MDLKTLLFEIEFTKLLGEERLDELSKAALSWGKKSGQPEAELQRAWDSAEATVSKNSGKPVEEFTSKEWGLTNNIYMRTVAKYSPGKVTELKKTVSKRWKTNSSKKTLAQRNDEFENGGVKPEPKKPSKALKNKLSSLTKELKAMKADLEKAESTSDKSKLTAKIKKLRASKKAIKDKLS